MATDVEEPEHHYEEIDCWAKLPDGWSFNEVSAVAIDSADQIYVFSRSEHPMTVFDRNGNFLRSWGEGVYQRPHGAHIGQDGDNYLTDDGVHIVHKCTLDGKVLLELGERGKPAPYMSGRPFHRCTHTALAPNGDIYVSDGYGNSRVHRVSPGGQAADVVGRTWDQAPGSSTFRTTFAAMRMAGSTWRIAKTTASRCSTATAATKRNGTICIAPAQCS